MGDKSQIEWTDATWNVVTGCTKVSPECARCYIERTPPFRIKGRRFVNGEIPLEFHEDRMMLPLKWRDSKRIFVNSLSDLFHRDVPHQLIVDVFGVALLAHWHQFQILTKREDRAVEFLAAGDHGILRQFMLLQQNGGTSTPQVFRALDLKRRHHIEWRWPPPNVRVGVSIGNQHWADRRFPAVCHLGEVGWNTMVSLEPLLGPLVIPDRYLELGRRAWIIVGGESGTGARPMHPDWVRSLRDQCQSAGVKFFFKQWGALDPFYDRDRDDPDWRSVPKEGPCVTRLNLAGGCGFHGERVIYFRKVGKKAAGRLLDGREWNEFPEPRNGV